ncbi:helix-turn-helix domain-containing protein [Aeromonas sp. DNRA1]|uniref:helix-turn-helix domain-containing protein n=1 Tax=Aeromonas sp. DNRA1 TaxID=2729335 RepID=UPI00403F70B6
MRVEEAAHAAEVSTRTAYKWLTRYRQEGPDGLYNRSSRAASCPYAIDDQRQQRIIELRKQRLTYRHISQSLGIGLSTVARILQRMGLNRLANLEPATLV